MKYGSKLMQERMIEIKYNGHGRTGKYLESNSQLSIAFAFIGESLLTFKCFVSFTLNRKTPDG